MFKNVATKFAIFAFDTTTGVPKTGDAANLTAYVSKDYGSVTVLGDTSATEMDSTNAKGWYLFDAAQAETNADALLVTAKSTTANISLVGQLIFTTPVNFSTLSIDSNGRVDVIKIAGTTQTARDIGASVLLASGQKVDVDTIKTNPVVNAGTVTFPTTATLASTTNITAGTITTVSGNVNGSVASVTDVNSIADGLLKRDMSAVTGESARSPLNAFRILRNKFSTSGTTLTVTKEDDTTSAWTSTLTTDATAIPITGSDPA